jgi:hypothetical protein
MKRKIKETSFEAGGETQVQSVVQTVRVAGKILRVAGRVRGKTPKMLFAFILGKMSNASAADADGGVRRNPAGDPIPYRTDEASHGAHLFICHREFLSDLRACGANSNISTKVMAGFFDAVKKGSTIKKSGDKATNLIRATKTYPDGTTAVVIDPYLADSMREFAKYNWKGIKLDFRNVARLKTAKTIGLYLDLKATLAASEWSRTFYKRGFFEISIPLAFLREDMEFGPESKHAMMTFDKRKKAWRLRKAAILGRIQKAMEDIQGTDKNAFGNTDLVFKQDPFLDVEFNKTTRRNEYLVHFFVAQYDNKKPRPEKIFTWPTTFSDTAMVSPDQQRAAEAKKKEAAAIAQSFSDDDLPF